MFVGNDGKIQSLNLTLPDAAYKVDTADVELLHPANIYLTATNGTTFKVSISNNGTLSAVQQTAPAQAVRMPGNFLISPTAPGGLNYAQPTAEDINHHQFWWHDQDPSHFILRNCGKTAFIRNSNKILSSGG